MLLIPTRDKDTADAPKTMAAWTGVVGPFTDGDMEEALSNLQAELDERGREAQHRFYVESGEQGALIAGARTTVTAWIGVLVGIVAPIIILLSQRSIVGLAATLAFALVGLGPGIMSHIDTGDPSAQAGLTLVLSMAAFALAATIMLWLASWQPTWLLLLAVPSVFRVFSVCMPDTWWPSSLGQRHEHHPGPTGSPEKSLIVSQSMVTYIAFYGFPIGS